MTSTTRRALYRVRNVARRMTQATAALRPVDVRELPLMARMALGGAERAASSVSDRLTKLLNDAEVDSLLRDYAKDEFTAAMHAKHTGDDA